MIAKCSCQNCRGAIEFDVNEFVEENSVVPCPHCGLETRLFIPTSIVPSKQSVPVHKNNKLGLAVGVLVVMIAIIASAVVYKRHVNRLAIALANAQLPDIKPHAQVPLPMLTNEENILIPKRRVSQTEATQKLLDESVQRVKDHYNSVEEVYYRKELETKEHFNHLRRMNAIESGASDLELEVMKLDQDEEIRAMEAIHAAKEAEWQRKEDEWFNERQKANE